MSSIPYVKNFEFEYGVAEQISPRIRRVIANNPGPFTYSGSGTYLIGTGRDVCIIDPGPYDLSHIETVHAAAGQISHILITHTHHDHCGGARALAERSGAAIYGFGPHPSSEPHLQDHALDEDGDEAFAPDHLIAHGDVLKGDGWTLTALHTPGHLSNHLCFALEEEKALFTGDHIMGWATTVVVPPAGDMQDYLDSLSLLNERDDIIYYPTHGAPIEKPQRFVRAIRTHRSIRDGQILELLKEGPRTIKEMVPVMYADINPKLHKAAAMNVYAHLLRLVKNGSVATDAQASVKSNYRLNT